MSILWEQEKSSSKFHLLERNNLADQALIAQKVD